MNPTDTIKALRDALTDLINLDKRCGWHSKEQDAAVAVLALTADASEDAPDEQAKDVKTLVDNWMYAFDVHLGGPSYDALREAIAARPAPVAATPALDCCDTPSFCSATQRCTAKDAATPAPGMAFDPLARHGEQKLREMLADLHREYRNRAEPLVKRLVAIEALKPPAPFVLDWPAAAPAAPTKQATRAAAESESNQELTSAKASNEQQQVATTPAPDDPDKPSYSKCASLRDYQNKMAVWRVVQSTRAASPAAPIAEEAGEQYFADVNCNEDRRRAGTSYPRTCAKCGLGPCKNLSSWLAWQARGQQAGAVDGDRRGPVNPHEPEQRSGFDCRARPAPAKK